MYENLIFSLDKMGVKASSQAVILAVRTVIPMDHKFSLLNSDFWLISKETNKKPYLIISISSLK
jgi:hypothetical protein